MSDERTELEDLIAHVDEASRQQTGGAWLEVATRKAGPIVREWDIAKSCLWSEWTGREQQFPGASKRDIGVDVVAVRRSDGGHIAIQCKARQLDERGAGAPISKSEIDSFASTSASSFWAERWIVTNGSVSMGSNAVQLIEMLDKPIKQVNIAHDLREQLESETSEGEVCPHCVPPPIFSGTGQQTKSCMQREAVAQSVRILREHEQSDSGGLPFGQARGKIILPCGTGKTRISLRIVEELTPSGAVSVVLCPSIALVAQIRREYLQHSKLPMRALAVCSDETAGYDVSKEDKRDTATDPTVDSSNVSASEVKGLVTTDPGIIAKWMHASEGFSGVSVIFGTYQSGHRIAKALADTGVTVSVLIADEAHRTAGFRRSRARRPEKRAADEQPLRDFTLCHDNDAFPAKYRVYQTATPRVYDPGKAGWRANDEWLVRTMDDESTFGVDLYRKSYVEAVENGWLADYRIIAIGINDQKAYDKANELANETNTKSRRPLTSHDFLHGLAFAMAMGGATQDEGSDEVPIKSCIAFMNTVDKSKNMAKALQTEPVRNWLADWLSENDVDRQVSPYTLEHLDASSNVTARDNAKQRLADASADAPHGVINVGIFGEGTDAPSLSAVAFLEPRKSPIDVIQAVGRAMRTMPGKERGYIICPVLIPPNADPEKHLSVSGMEDWKVLGQILLALRAHDQRIEDKLTELLDLRLPPVPEMEHSFVGYGDCESRRAVYGEFHGELGGTEKALNRVLSGESLGSDEFIPAPTTAISDAPIDQQPTQIVTGIRNDDGSNELRIDTVIRTEPEAGEIQGNVDYQKSKKRAQDMMNRKSGTRLEERNNTPGDERNESPEEDSQPPLSRDERAVRQVFRQLRWDENSNAIRMNLLAKSGLTANRVVRDLNLLEGGVKEAAHHLGSDGLKPALDRHFGLDNLKAGKERADGCTIAALLMMNAAMLHQRIAKEDWMDDVEDLENVSSNVNVIPAVSWQWTSIISRDFKPVMAPALKVMNTIESTGKRGGLERALRHLASEAARIAETYADMGADHAGALFNRVMGDQASDGAFFTRPVAASIAARLTLDTVGDVDWTDRKTWLHHKTVDLACGSGTLLAAMLTEMKRRAREQGADRHHLGELQKLAVEKTIKGMDINPVSLQLAASQLTAGNQGTRYSEMGLHIMPYGPASASSNRSRAGTLELLGQRAIVARDGAMDVGDDDVGSKVVWGRDGDDGELEDAVKAAADSRIVIMNPPFTNRQNMGGKFPSDAQGKLRDRVETMRDALIANDPPMADFGDKNSIAPLFVALAEKCVSDSGGVLTMIHPTIALSNPSGVEERRILAQRFHIHTVLTCHVPGQINLSENTSINESLILLKRRDGDNPPTRFIALDRMPSNAEEVGLMHEQIRKCGGGAIAEGWGEIANWPAVRMEEGDWTPGMWRSPKLAEASFCFSEDPRLMTMRQSDYLARRTDLGKGAGFQQVERVTAGSFDALYSGGTTGQTKIESRPNSSWVRVKRGTNQSAHGLHAEADPILSKAGHLLIASSQDAKSARLTAVASDTPYVGTGWLPVQGLPPIEAKALAVFINSTPGRLQLMRNAARKLGWPQYGPKVMGMIRIPDAKDERILGILAGCWERTKDMEVPQFGEGECDVRRLWDEAVAEAMDWDPDELSRLRHLLHREPHVCGIGYGQYRG